MIAIPVPFLLIFAKDWNQVVFANVLLGMSQGLTWSSTVVMKIDLVGEKNRGLAMGLNEFSGYVAVGLLAFLSGFVASRYGITPYPFYLGIFMSVAGLLMSIFFIHDTSVFVAKESLTSTAGLLNNVFMETTFKNRTLSAVTQAGMVNNLNDGMIWGLLPVLLMSQHYSTENAGIITAIYPGVWGLGQIFTGKMSDTYSKKSMLFWGMLIQGLAIILIPMANNFWMYATISTCVGFGTALVYPTFLSAIAQATSPQQRAESIGTFRLWRDLGYAFGAVISGLVADWLGLEYAILLIGILTICSSLIIRWRMPGKPVNQ
jgi:predicted MFS family arabinose efflux permease